MADPLSTAASVTALLTFSIHSCRYLHNFFSDISDAPAEVKHYLLSLEALAATFSELRNISNDTITCTDSVFTDDFRRRLKLCKMELGEMQALLRGMGSKMQGKMLVRSWGRVKFALSDKELLKEFWSRLSMQQSVFTLDLIAAHTKLTLRHSSQLTMTKSHTQQLLNFLVPCDAESWGNLLTAPGLSPISQATSWHTFHSFIGTVTIYRRRVKTNGAFKRVPSITTLGTICGFRLQLRPSYGVWGQCISVFLYREDTGISSQLNLRQSLYFAPILPRKALIFQYIREGNLRMVRSMFQCRKATPSDTMPDGVTLLHLACRQSNLELVEHLLNSGADIHASDDDGRTSLHWALEHSNSFEICRALLRHGADTNVRDIEQKTPLHTYFNPAIAAILVDHRDVVGDFSFDQYGMNLLHFTAWSSRSSPSHIAPFIKAQPSLCEIPDNEGRMLIHFASERGNAPLLEYLFDQMPNIDVMLLDDKGRTPIHYAARTKRISAMQVLLSKGANMHATTPQGWTVLHEAAAQNNVKALKNIIELLGRQATATLKVTSNQGLTPLMLARKRRAHSAFEFLKPYYNTDIDDMQTNQDIQLHLRKVGQTKQGAHLTRLDKLHLVGLFVVLALSLFRCVMRMYGIG